MISRSGNGASAETVFYTSALPAGFYTIAYRGSVDGSQQGVTIRRNDVSHGNLSEGSPPYATAAWVEPGDEFSYEAYLGGGSAVDWEFDFYLFAKADVAYEEP